MTLSEKDADLSLPGGEIVVFAAGDIISGMSIRHVQEICKNPDITKVYRSSDYIRGVMNLRGHVVTIIDLRIVFGMTSAPQHRSMRIIIVKSQGEQVGLLVDSVDDIIEIEPEGIEPPPSNVRGVAGSLFSGIYTESSCLIALLNLEEALRIRKVSEVRKHKSEGDL